MLEAPSSSNNNITATVVFTRGNSLLSAQSSSKSNYVEPASGSNHDSNSYQSTSTSTSTSNNTSKNANVNDSMEMEDDMMDFLTDDSNF